MRAKKFSGLTLVCLPFLACSASNNTNVDAHIRLIDGGKMDSGSGSAVCSVAASYGTPNFGSNQQATNYPAAGSGSAATIHQEEWDGLLNETPEVILDISLYEGYGAFETGDIETGTFPLTGSDGVSSTCGACVAIFGNLGSDSVGDFYTANAGTLTLTSVTGTIAGSISNVTLVHVGTDAMDNPTDTPVDSCASSITSATFSSPLAAGSAVGKSPFPIVLHHRYR